MSVLDVDLGYRVNMTRIILNRKGKEMENNKKVCINNRKSF